MPKLNLKSISGLKLRLIIWGLIFSIVFNLLGNLNAWAHDSLTLGGDCSHPGNIQVIQGKKAVCVVISEREAVWKNWSLQLQNSPFQRNTGSTKPTISQSGVNSLTPQSKSLKIPKPSDFPSSFSNLFKNRAAISYEAWQKISHAASQNDGSYKPQLTIFSGPNTPAPNMNLLVGFNLVHNIFKKYDGFKNIIVFVYNATDSHWAYEKANEVMGSEITQDISKFHDYADIPLGKPHAPPLDYNAVVHCAGSTACNASDAWGTNNGTVYIGIGLPQDMSSFQKGPTDSYITWSASEYWHAIWQHQYVLNNSLQPNQIINGNELSAQNAPPFWFTLAGEQISQDEVSFPQDYSAYLNDMQSRFSGLDYAIKGSNNQLGSIFNAEFLNNFLNEAHSQSMDSLSWRNGNFYSDFSISIGTRILEMLVALKGPGVTVDIASDMSRGMNFTQAFAKETGTTWDDAKGIISKVLLDEYQNHY